MMLFKLSAKNIAKSIKDYAIYFFTLILGVAIFYVFNAIDSQTVMLDVSKNTSDIIKLMTGMLSGVSVFVSIILGCLIIYASIFLIKRRNKEFGVYLTLGMGKRKISLVLFFETLIIGIISLIVGLVIGTAFSQLMSIVVANMFEADMRKFEFVFSRSACIKTLIYFGIMYVFVMVFNTWTIGKCKLIDLLNGRKRNEKIKNKNSIVCIMVFIISCVVLGRAYYLVTVGVNELESSMDILIPIMLGIVGTLLFFWSVSGLILKIVMAKKSTYYKGLNSFVLRQISSKINTTVVQMTIICIMLFVTICVLSSAFSIKNSLSENIQKMCPADVQITVGKEVKNDSSSDTITLNLYYKPTVLTVSKTVTGYNMEPNRSYEFTIKAVPPSGTDASTATITAGKIFIRKGNDEVKNLTFTNNRATFTLAKDESVDISCLPTGWTYTVTETNPGKNYKTSYILNGSDAIDGTAAEIITSTTGNDEVTFTNASTVAPPETGRTFHDSEWILLLIVILVISAGGMTFLRKMKKRY